VFLNANFFKIYQEISTSDAKRELIIQSRQDVIEALTQRSNPSPTAATAGARPQPASDNAESSQKAANVDPTQQTVQSWFQAARQEIDSNASIFTGYGFAPIDWHNTSKWIGTWNPSNSADWVMYRKHDLSVLLGWIAMALLLSVGAPFWQDFLESLFGIKNVLRKQSGTQNVEQDSGDGQTKQG
jgi:hypothetical protein